MALLAGAVCHRGLAVPRVTARGREREPAPALLGGSARDGHVFGGAPRASGACDGQRCEQRARRFLHRSSSCR